MLSRDLHLFTVQRTCQPLPLGVGTWLAPTPEPGGVLCVTSRPEPLTVGQPPPTCPFLCGAVASGTQMTPAICDYNRRSCYQPLTDGEGQQETNLCVLNR